MAFLNGIFALDRLLRRVPSIIEVWFLEFLAIIPLALAFGSWLDRVGLRGCPPAGFGVDGSSIGIALFGLAMGFLAVRRILKPKIARIEWTPVHTVKNMLPVPIPVPQRAARIEYEVLSSHPSYAFVHLLTLPIPAVGLLATDSCATSFFPLFGGAGIALIAALIILRIISWYGLRRGRDEIERKTPQGMTAKQMEWAFAWQPMISMVVLISLCIGIPLFIVWLRVQLGYGI